jgi:hypothetical protein
LYQPVNPLQYKTKTALYPTQTYVSGAVGCPTGALVTAEGIILDVVKHRGTGDVSEDFAVFFLHTTEKNAFTQLVAYPLHPPRAQCALPIPRQQAGRVRPLHTGMAACPALLATGLGLHR